MSEKCPCCSGKQYSLCCEPYLSGAELPVSAEALMRSRYTAYVQKKAAYLVSTWHPGQRVPEMEQLLSESFHDTQWLGLTVTCCNHGSQENEAFVTFFARYLEKERPAALYERSRFLREDQRWYYVDGTSPEVGRNDRCPCGSGKKYKKCCG